mgnify:CR=1 FL=1
MEGKAVIAIILVAIICFAAGFYTYPAVVKPAAPPTPPTPAPTTWDKIVERGKIRVATSPDWPPFEYIDPETGKIVGYEVDLMELVAERLGLEVEWVPMSFAGIISAVQAKDVDLGVSGFSITPERCEVVQYCIPHIITRAEVIMLKSRAEELGITTLESLEELGEYGLTCGVEMGTTQEAELMDLEKAGKLPAGTCKSYENYDLAMEDMFRGAVDTVYMESPIASYWILEHPEEIVIIFSKPYWPVAWVAHQDSDVLVSKINGVLAELIAEGKVKELQEKWKV